MADPKPRREAPEDKPGTPSEVSISGERRPDGKAVGDGTTPEQPGDAAPLETFEPPGRPETRDGGAARDSGKKAIDAV